LIDASRYVLENGKRSNIGFVGAKLVRNVIGLAVRSTAKNGELG